MKNVDSLTQEELIKEVVNSYYNWGGGGAKVGGEIENLGNGLIVKRDALPSRLEERLDDNLYESEFMTFLLNKKIVGKVYWDFDEDSSFETPHIISMDEEALKGWLKNKLGIKTSASTIKAFYKKADGNFINNNKEYYDALLRAKNDLQIIINQDDKIGDNGNNDYGCLNDTLALIEEFIEAVQS